MSASVVLPVRVWSWSHAWYLQCTHTHYCTAWEVAQCPCTPLSSGALRIVQWKPVTSCPERPRPQRPGSRDSQEARPLDSWLSWTPAVQSPFFHPRKAPSCRLSLGATRTLPSVLTCFFSSLVGCLTATLHIVCAPPPPPEGSFSSSFQSLVVGGQQLVGAWQREGSWGRQGGRGNFLCEGVFRVPLG